jgi:hypothetical protein
MREKSIQVSQTGFYNKIEKDSGKGFKQIRF